MKIGVSPKSIVSLISSTLERFLVMYLVKVYSQCGVKSCLYSVFSVIAGPSQIMGLRKKERYSVCFFLKSPFILTRLCMVLWLKHFHLHLQYLS